MNLDVATLERLMAYADGELDGAERAEMEALVQSNEDAARVVRELGTLGDCVRVVHEAQAPSFAVADRIADAVMARIEVAEAQVARAGGNGPLPTSVLTQARVVDLAARRRRNLGLVGALVAAAAAVVVFARPNTSENAPARVAQDQAPVAPSPTAVNPPTGVAPSTTSTAGALASADQAASATAPTPAETPSNVSVIVVPREGETAASVVIWLGEDSLGGGPVK